jgi:hypothetical protein
MTFALNIIRGQSTPEGTPGKLSSTADIPFICDTLELEWQNNKTGVSCILPDSYDAWLWDSPSLGHLVVRLQDKHGRVSCLLHNMNFAGEAAGEETQVHGCTGVGNGYGQLKNNEGNMQFAILSSVATLSNLVQHIISQVGETAHFTVNYSWADGCAPADLTDLNGVST